MKPNAVRAHRSRAIGTAALAAALSLTWVALPAQAGVKAADESEPTPSVLGLGEGTPAELELLPVDEDRERPEAFHTTTALDTGAIQVDFTNSPSTTWTGTIYVEDLYGAEVTSVAFNGESYVDIENLPVGDYRVFVDYTSTYADSYTYTYDRLVPDIVTVVVGSVTGTGIASVTDTTASLVGVLRAPATWNEEWVCLVAVNWATGSERAFCGYQNTIFRLDYLSQSAEYAFVVVPEDFAYKYQFDPYIIDGLRMGRYGSSAGGDWWTFTLGGTGVYWLPLAFFNDVNAGSQFFDHIMWMADSEISTGYDDGTFRPTASVSRQAMAAFMYRFAGEPEFTPPDESPFSDVPTTSPFYLEITWMADAGISTGYDDDTFRPQASVSRQAMAAFMYRFAGEPEFTPPDTSPFSDVPTGGQFYLPVTWMADTGISTGYDGGTFRPAASVSRQAMAAFMFRLNELNVI